MGDLDAILLKLLYLRFLTLSFATFERARKSDMKTERRHELQENELAHLLVEQSTKAQPYVKILAGVTVLVAAVLIGWSYITSHSQAQQEAAWAAFYAATNTGDPSEFRKVAETYPGTLASGWALESAGDLLLNNGVGDLFRDKEQAAKQMDAARSTFEAVINTFDDEMLIQRATFGLAKTYESMGDLAKATEIYESITKKWPNAEFTQAAADRLDAINRPQAKEWYAWLSEQKPVVNAASNPGAFGDLPVLPDSPDMSMPKPGELLGPSTGETEGVLPGGLLDSSAPATDGTNSAAPAETSESGEEFPLADPAPTEDTSAADSLPSDVEESTDLPSETP